jgi:signal transduction histidine kinase
VTRAKSYATVGISLAVLLLISAAGNEGATFVGGVIGRLAAGLFAAVAVFALFAYRDRRDPTLLLVGVGAATLVLHEIVVAAAYLAVQPSLDDTWTRLIGASQLTGLAVLLGDLLAVVPLRDRRGRPPLQPGLVVAANFAAVVVLDVIAVSSDHFPDLVGVVLVVGGVVAAVRSFRWNGRFAWVAAGGLGLTVTGLAIVAGPRVHGGQLGWIVSGWQSAGPTLTGMALAAFVVTSLHVEASRARRASDRATEVMEGRAEIASIVAHDVRGPAGTIRSVAGSLRTSYQRLGDPERLEFVGMIEQESLRLLRVADQMSLGLKADAATLPYTMVVRDLEGPVLQGLHDAEVGSREVRLDIDTEIRASVDARWLAEAVRQGIENAMKFSPPDTPIDLRVRTDGDTAVIEVQDAGPSIPPELREQVFEKFCRWRPHGYEDVSGSGLGLFIVRTIAREHGGDARIATGAGDTGTILEIRVPREAPGDG